MKKLSDYIQIINLFKKDVKAPNNNKSGNKDDFYKDLSYDPIEIDLGLNLVSWLMQPWKEIFQKKLKKLEGGLQMIQDLSFHM